MKRQLVYKDASSEYGGWAFAYTIESCKPHPSKIYVGTELATQIRKHNTHNVKRL